VIPPFKKRNPPKGENRGGHQRGGLYGADGGMEPLYLHASHARSGLAVRAPPPSGSPPLRRSTPFAPSAPRGGARWSGRHRLSPFRASTRCRPSVERRRSSRASGCKCSPESRLHRSPYSVAAACRCRRRRRHRHAAAKTGSAPASIAPAKPSRCLLVAPPGRPEAVTFSLQPPEMVGRLKEKRVEFQRLDTGGLFASNGWKSG